MIDYPVPLLNSMLVPTSIYKALRRGTDTSKEFNLIIFQFYFPGFTPVFLNLIINIIYNNPDPDKLISNNPTRTRSTPPT